MLLLAVQKPQKVPRSRSGYQDVRMRAHAGEPRPCGHRSLFDLCLPSTAEQANSHSVEKAPLFDPSMRQVFSQAAAPPACRGLSL